MAGMTKDALVELIKETTLPLLKDTVGKDIADAVKASVEAAVAPLRQPTGDAAGKLFGGKESETPKRAVGTAFARCLRATAAAKLAGQGPDKAIDILKGWGDKDLADQWAESRAKALASNDPTAGGFLVPTQFSQDVIELLRPAAVVRSLNPMTLPMPTGTVKVPKVTEGTTAAYIGENSNAGKTQPEFGQITMTFKKLAALVPISNDLIRYSSPSGDAIVRDDVVRAMAQREDKAFLRDNGVSATPKGLKFWIHNDNKLAANGTVNLANVTIDLGRMVQALMAANVPLGIGATNLEGAGARPGWIMSPRTYRYLITVQNGQGFYAFRDEMLRGTLWGWPYRVTTQVLETMTAAGADTGGNQSELYFGAFAHAVIGEALGVMVDASQEAAYHDGSNVVAAFSQDQTVIRVIQEHDFALRHDKAFALLQQMTWGV
jgi:HK97 family phage major capsid protein